MDVITFNVGQGGMAMIRNGDEAIVVDARIPPSDDSVAHVKGLLATFGKGHNIRGLLLTGFDKDHADIVGVALVLRKYRPDWILYPDYESDTESFEAVEEEIRDQQRARKNTGRPLRAIPLKMNSLPANGFEDLANTLSLEFFSPHPEDMDSSNNSSIVAKVTGTGENAFSYLITGDTENSRWKSINAIFGNRLSCDVMAAPHHGSRNGTNGETLSLVMPNTILISAGVDNPYGHPDAGVLQAYTSIAQHVFATNSDGGQSLHTKRNGNDIRTIAFVD